MLSTLLPLLLPIFGDAIRRVFPDQEAQRRAEAEFSAALLARAGELEQAAAGIVAAEAKSEHWLTACWRPIVMLTFTGLLVARWLGFAAPGLSEAEVLKLWSIVELGLGGYVIGRSAEKIVPQLADALRRPR